MGTATSRVVVRPAHTLSRDDFRRLPLSRLRCGQQIRFPIHADDGMLLLAEGSEITSRILEILEGRGYTTVLVHRMEQAAGVSLEPTGSLATVPEDRPGAVINLQNRTTRALDHEMVDRIAEAKDKVEDPFIKEIPHLGTAPFSETLAREIYDQHESFIGSLRDSVQKVMLSDPEGQTQADNVLDSYLRLLVEDIDLFASFASAPGLNQYPHRHSLHVAMLALAMGVRAGLSEESLHHLGLGALFHDMGMLRVPKQVWGAKHGLSPQQQLDVMAHPIYSVDMIGHLPLIAPEVKYIAYQVHERANGQGYPRRVPGEMIHPLARIVGVADAYVALLCERPHRAAVQPYRAVENIVKGAATGRFDRSSVRLLLQTVSLYPVGSYVLLSNNQLAKVLRTNSDRYDRPVVRMWPPRTPPSDNTGDVIDLASIPDLKVIETLPSPASA